MKELILSGVMGSRAYGFDVQDSDYDLMGIYSTDPENLYKRNFDPIRKADNGVYYEVGYFCDLLEQGSLDQTLLLFLERHLHQTTVASFLTSVKYELLTKETLQKWLYLSSTFYSKALRIGTMKIGILSPIDFITYYPNLTTATKVQGKPLREVMSEGGFYTYNKGDLPIRTDKVCLWPIVNDIYSIYWEWQKEIPPTTKGLIDEHGEIIEKGLIGGSTYLINQGIVYYDKKRYKKYQQAKKEINKSRVLGGYGTKSMMHAFRVLELICTYLDTDFLELKVKEPLFYHRLRKGEYLRADCISQYGELFDQTKGKLELYDRIKDPNLIPNVLEEIRSKYKKIVEYDSRWGY